MRQALRWLPAALLLCAAPVAAQVTAPAGAGPKEPPIPVTKLKLQPAKAPVPALKYRLLPELRDLKPGNAVLLYYRAFSPEWQTFHKGDDFWKAVEKWEDDKTKPPPAYLGFVKHFAALQELDLGARRAYCDWEMIDRLRKDGIGMLLPDIQSFRTYIILLAARARFEMLDKKYDKAVYTLQTGYTLSRHVSEGPILIQALVGAAMTAQMNMELEQLIQQPGAPNLYWALTDLPAPFIDLRKSLQGEKLIIDSLFPGWREMAKELEAKPLSPPELEAFLLKILYTAQVAGIKAGPGQQLGAKLVLAALAAKAYPAARQFLLDQGQPKQLVDQMPVTQVALLYEIYNYDRFYDDFMKWYGLPYPQMYKGITKANQALKSAKAAASVGTTLGTLLLPAVQKVMNVSYRIECKLAGLRCVEAIRLYAAAHDGKVPAALDDIDEVPVPMNPYTGSPFEYHVTKKGATLTAPPPAGDIPQNASWTYEIAMQP